MYFRLFSVTYAVDMKALKQITTTFFFILALGVFLSSCQKDEEMFNPANADQSALDGASLRSYQGDNTNSEPSQANLGGNDPDPNGGGGDPLVKDGDDTDDDDNVKDGDDTDDDDNLIDDEDGSALVIIKNHSSLSGSTGSNQ